MLKTISGASQIMRAINGPPMAGNSTKINAISFYDFNCLKPLPTSWLAI
jgi:hypothetical protein